MYEFPYGGEQQLNLNWIINEIITLHKRLDPDYELPNFDNAFPYMNLNQLNLDWILRELKAIKDLAPTEDAQLLKMVANALIANTYDAETQYNVDDIVYRDSDNRLYKCITATPAGGEPFDSSKWVEVDVGGVLTDLLTSQATTVEPYDESPAMNGTASAGTSTQYARGDHVHPKDTTRVPTSRTVNGKALSGNITLNASDIPNDSNVTGENVDDALNNLDTATNAKMPIYNMEFIGSNGIPTDAEIIQSIGFGNSADSFAVNFTINGNSSYFVIWQKRTASNAAGIGFGYYETYNKGNAIIKFLYANNVLTKINCIEINNKNLAVIDNEDNASRAYITGELLVHNDALYRVIAPIAANQAFTVNTNIVLADLATINDSGSNYTRMADGTLIQWGEGFIPQGVYVQIDYTTFATPFINTNYKLAITPADSIILTTPTEQQKAATGFKCGRTPNTATNYYDWIAIGRWK